MAAEMNYTTPKNAGCRVVGAAEHTIRRFLLPAQHTMRQHLGGARDAFSWFGYALVRAFRAKPFKALRGVRRIGANIDRNDNGRVGSRRGRIRKLETPL